MKFTLEVDIDQISTEKTADGLGRNLRYWAGNLNHYPLTDGDSEVIYDSANKAVGAWKIANSPTA